MSLDGATAVITGASRGLGAAVAHEFADAGAHVVLCARTNEDLETVAESIESEGGTATTMRGDVRDEFDMERFMETAAREAGAIDVLVANAGVYHGPPGETPLGEESYSAFDDTLRTNVRGVHTTIKEALPHLAADARVLVPSGAIADEHQPGYGVYAVSKAAAEAVIRGYAAEEEQVFGVVRPGQVSTALTNDGPGRDPADVAGIFLWAAAEADAGAIDGEVVDLRAWRQATR